MPNITFHECFLKGIGGSNHNHPGNVVARPRMSRESGDGIMCSNKFEEKNNDFVREGYTFQVKLSIPYAIDEEITF